MSVNPGFRVIEPSGILNMAASQTLKQQLSAYLEAQVRDVLIDLQAVNFIDSSGLGVLVAMHTQMRLASGRLYLCAPNDQARNLFDISDMDRIFEIFASREAFSLAMMTKNQDGAVK